MKKTPSRKLSLKRETVRSLEDGSFAHALGGATIGSNYNSCSEFNSLAACHGGSLVSACITNCTSC
jgi:hypothetical protein